MKSIIMQAQSDIEQIYRFLDNINRPNQIVFTYNRSMSAGYLFLKVLRNGQVDLISRLYEDQVKEQGVKYLKAYADLELLRRVVRNNRGRGYEVIRCWVSDFPRVEQFASLRQPIYQIGWEDAKEKEHWLELSVPKRKRVGSKTKSQLSFKF